MAGGARICLGQIGAAHGVHGEVRLRSYTSDPRAIANYGPLQTEDGRVFAIESLKAAGDHFVARFSGVHDREAARALHESLMRLARRQSRDAMPQLCCGVRPQTTRLAGVSGCEDVIEARGAAAS